MTDERPYNRPVDSHRAHDLFATGEIDSWNKIFYSFARRGKEFTKEARDWCGNTAKGNWICHVGVPAPLSDTNVPYRPAIVNFYFEDPKDAVLFKLTFGSR